MHADVDKKSERDHSVVGKYDNSKAFLEVTSNNQINILARLVASIFRFNKHVNQFSLIKRPK